MAQASWNANLILAGHPVLEMLLHHPLLAAGYSASPSLLLETMGVFTGYKMLQALQGEACPNLILFLPLY